MKLGASTVVFTKVILDRFICHHCMRRFWRWRRPYVWYYTFTDDDYDFLYDVQGVDDDDNIVPATSEVVLGYLRIWVGWLICDCILGLIVDAMVYSQVVLRCECNILV